MRKFTTLILLLFINIGVFSQKPDSLKYLTGFEKGYHNIAILQAPKGKFYYKNTEILYQSFGKNFWNFLEIEAGFLTFDTFFFRAGHLKTSFVFPISDKINFGVTTHVLGTFLEYPSNIRDKYEISSGFTYKDEKSLHSLNFNYGKLFYYYNHGSNPPELIWNIYSYSFTYNFVRKLDKNLFFVLDNKFHFMTIDFNLPENYGNKDIKLLEQFYAARYVNKKHIINIGSLTFIGYRGKDQKVNFLFLPFVSYALIL